MKNDFRLQTVLDYTSNIVDTLELDFAQLKLVHKNEAAALQNLDTARNQEMNALQNQQQGLLNCNSIQLRQQYLDTLDVQITQQKVRVKMAEKKVNDKREELVDTMKEQKTLEKLKTNHHTTQQLELRRREARVVDDIVTTRYARKR